MQAAPDTKPLSDVMGRMREIVANFDNTWELTSADIDADLAAIAR